MAPLSPLGSLEAGDLVGTRVCEQVLSLNFQQLSLGIGEVIENSIFPLGASCSWAEAGTESWEQGYRNSMLWGWMAEPAARHSIV